MIVIHLLYLFLFSIFNSEQISDCAMVLEEQPAKMAEAFRLFPQGEGYGEC